MRERFSNVRGEHYNDQLMSLIQSETLEDYLDVLERIHGCTKNRPLDFLEDAFVKGLKPKLRSMVSKWGPRWLDDAIVLAHRADECECTRSKEHIILVGTDAPDRPFPVTLISTSANVPTIGAATYNTFKRLAETEYAAKRAHGLCF